MAWSRCNWRARNSASGHVVRHAGRMAVGGAGFQFPAHCACSSARPRENAARLASSAAAGRLRPSARSRFRGGTADSGSERRAARRSCFSCWAGGTRRSAEGSMSRPPAASAGAVHFDLVGRDDDEKIRFAFRDHGAEDALAEAHVARNRAAALAHAVKLALLHVDAGRRRRRRPGCRRP